jgi:lactate 2-monooxygenase
MHFGNRVQFEVYRQFKKSKYPVRYEDLVEKAREVLEEGPFYYVEGGAGAEDTVRANRRAFQKWQIVPRMFRDVSKRDFRVKLFGQTYDFPLLMAPIGVQSIIHQEGELGAAKAAAELRVPFVASTASTYSLEEIAQAMGDAPRWFQLYWSKDRDVAASMVERAERAGYAAIVVTLDTPMMAWRENDINQGYLPFLLGEGIGNYLSDPAFRAKLSKPPETDPEEAILYWTKVFGNESLTWDELPFLRRHTRLPILLKGILHPHDAELAVKHGMDGIIVSNHGGRQVDGAIGTLDALGPIVDVVQGRIPVLMDSGIRRGADMIKALALGASAVLVGRPYVFGLALGGQEGVMHVVRNLLADFDLTMALSGFISLADLNRSILVKADQ